MRSISGVRIQHRIGALKFEREKAAEYFWRWGATPNSSTDRFGREEIPLNRGVFLRGRRSCFIAEILKFRIASVLGNINLIYRRKILKYHIGPLGT